MLVTPWKGLLHSILAPPPQRLNPGLSVGFSGSENKETYALFPGWKPKDGKLPKDPLYPALCQRHCPAHLEQKGMGCRREFSMVLEWQRSCEPKIFFGPERYRNGQEEARCGRIPQSGPSDVEDVIHMNRIRGTSGTIYDLRGCQPGQITTKNQTLRQARAILGK